MSKKTRNIVVTILLCVLGLGFIGYGTYMLVNKEVDIVTPATPDFTDEGVDYYGNKWRLEAYNNDEGKYVMLEVYMEEEHDMKWYGTVASGPAAINYIIYQNDHYVMSVNPNLSNGSSEIGFLFDQLEPNHSVTNTYLYYGLSIITGEDGVQYHVIGGELTDEAVHIGDADDINEHEADSADEAIMQLNEVPEVEDNVEQLEDTDGAE